eukprot:7406010-Pyramimonas_sp.AAC.1
MVNIGALSKHAPPQQQSAQQGCAQLLGRGASDGRAGGVQLLLICSEPRGRAGAPDAWGSNLAPPTGAQPELGWGSCGMPGSALPLSPDT